MSEKFSKIENPNEKKITEFSDFIQQGRKIFDTFIDLREDKISVENARTTISGFLKKSQEYSIADMATYPWIARHEWQGMLLGDYPAVQRWFDEISARPAVKRGMVVPF